MPPGRGSAAGPKFLAPPYYSQHAVFALPLSAFFRYFLSPNQQRQSSEGITYTVFKEKQPPLLQAVAAGY